MVMFAALVWLPYTLPSLGNLAFTKLLQLAIQEHALPWALRPIGLVSSAFHASYKGASLLLCRTVLSRAHAGVMCTLRNGNLASWKVCYDASIPDTTFRAIQALLSPERQTDVSSSELYEHLWHSIPAILAHSMAGRSRVDLQSRVNIRVAALEVTDSQHGPLPILTIGPFAAADAVGLLLSVQLTFLSQPDAQSFENRATITTRQVETGRAVPPRMRSGPGLPHCR